MRRTSARTTTGAPVPPCISVSPVCSVHHPVLVSVSPSVCPSSCLSVTVHVWQLSGWLSLWVCVCVCVSVLKALCLQCQTHWDRHRRDVMATLSDSTQIRHALTGLDCGWASKLPATIRDTSKRMGLTLQVISQIKPVGGTSSPFAPQYYTHQHIQ